MFFKQFSEPCLVRNRKCFLLSFFTSIIGLCVDTTFKKKKMLLVNLTLSFRDFASKFFPRIFVRILSKFYANQPGKMFFIFYSLVFSKTKKFCFPNNSRWIPLSITCKPTCSLSQRNRNINQRHGCMVKCIMYVPDSNKSPSVHPLDQSSWERFQSNFF